MNIFHSSILSFNSINVVLSSFDDFHINDLTIFNGQRLLTVKKYTFLDSSMLIELNESIDIKIKCYINFKGNILDLNYFELYKSKEFNDKYFTNDSLGCTYSKEKSTFKIWSPPASSVTLLIYNTYLNSEEPRKVNMNESNGLWSISVKGDLNGLYYTYEVIVHDIKSEAVDPYAKAVGINGLRAAIIDLKDTTPAGFYETCAPSIAAYTDAIIYELSIRDITRHISSGVINKGKFLGLTEENTLSSDGLPTGLEHIKELGVTHIQLMPVFDFSYYSVDEKNPVRYNWGYDPQNFNAPEGSYSTEPYNPLCRIYELKKLIHVLHKNGLSVVMDMVYNHVYHNTDNSFEKIFPGYYFRYDNFGNRSNGSGCGNDIASEQPMVRKFIIDSVLYWTKEYNLDGLRFDLMGLLDITTISIIRKELDSVNRPVMLYGEGWNMNTLLSEDQKANMYNSHKFSSVGHFNDNMRDAVKGSIFSKEDKGYISGKENLEDVIKKCIVGSINYNDEYKGLFITPEQSVNYVSAHDNNTLWDKLKYSTPEDNNQDRKEMHKLANAIVLLSQGIPFLHSGVEFCRTKQGIENSYNSPDKINNIDWHRKAEFYDVFNYYKGLIKIRKEHPAFRMSKAEEVKKHLILIPDTPKGVIVFMLTEHANNDPWRTILVIFNADKNNVKLNIPFGKWNLTSDKYIAGTEILRYIETDCIEVEALSFNLLYKN